MAAKHEMAKAISSHLKGRLFGKPRSSVIKHPGSFSAAARLAGKSTHALAEKDKSEPGIMGKRARLALAFERMRRDKKK